MRITQQDLDAQSPEFRKAFYQTVETAEPEDVIYDEIEDEVEYVVEDNSFDYEYGSIRSTHHDVRIVGESADGRVTIEFNSLSDCADEDTLTLRISKEADYETIYVVVEASPVETLRREDVTVPFRGESVTYTAYKVVYEWKTTGEAEVG